MSTEKQNHQEHLTEEQIALCADAMAMEEFSRITPQMRAHLESCDQCAQEVNEAAKIVRKSFSDSLSSAILHAQQPKPKNTWWIGVAAGILLILGVGYIFKDQIFINDNQLAVDSDSSIVTLDSNAASQENQIAHESNTTLIDTAAMQDQSLSTEHVYAVNSDLEGLVKRFESANQRSDELEVVTPSILKGKAGELILQWKAEDDAYLSIEIYDHTNTKIESVSSSSGKMQPKAIKTQGNYYWKLMNEDFDLLFCGKIVVE